MFISIIYGEKLTLVPIVRLFALFAASATRSAEITIPAKKCIHYSILANEKGRPTLDGTPFVTEGNSVLSNAIPSLWNCSLTAHSDPGSAYLRSPKLLRANRLAESGLQGSTPE